MVNESWKRAIIESRAWTEKEATAAIAALTDSGMSVASFARMYGSTKGRLHYWLRRLRGALG